MRKALNCLGIGIAPGASFTLWAFTYFGEVGLEWQFCLVSLNTSTLGVRQ